MARLVNHAGTGCTRVGWMTVVNTGYSEGRERHDSAFPGASDHQKFAVVYQADFDHRVHQGQTPGFLSVISVISMVDVETESY